MGESAIEVMLRHRSIRRFTEEPVGEALLREIVECGLRASNTGNMQLYSVIATREEPRRSQLLQLHYGQCATAPLLLTVCTDVHRYHRYCQVNQCDEPYGNLLWWASALVDASLFAQNLGLAAEARGLGFCHLGTVMYNTAQIAALLECPEGVVPVITLALGHPAEEGRMSERIGPEGVMHSEVYHPYTDDDIRRIHAVRDTDPFNQEMVRQNGTRNYCEIFTTKRYPRQQNEEISAKLEAFLRGSGMMS